MAVVVHSPILGPPNDLSRGVQKKTLKAGTRNEPLPRSSHMWGYVAVFAAGVYYAPTVKKKIRKLRRKYGV
jgi:hypothetical protein